MSNELINPDNKHILEKFLDEMKIKYNVKHNIKGDSWVGRGFRDSKGNYITMNDWLRKCLKDEIKEYDISCNVDELIDVANYCAMLYLREKKLVKLLPKSCLECPIYKNPCYAFLNIIRHPEHCIKMIGDNK